MADLTNNEQLAKDFTVALLQRPDFPIDFKDNIKTAENVCALYNSILETIKPKVQGAYQLRPRRAEFGK